MRALSLTLMAIAAVLCMSFLVDCTCARAEWRVGTVTDKIIRPPWTEFHTDGKGHTYTSYHPEEYFVVASVNGSTGRIEVWPSTYDSFHAGDNCEVQFRQGHLMTYGYLTIRHGAW